MSKIIIIILPILFINTFLYSQNKIDSVLAEIEINNTTLAAYRKIIDAEKTGNKTGILPSNPEIEFNYLWGSPEAIGKRTDISITQSFDFPTVYVYKSQIVSLQNEQAEMEYKKQRYEVLFQARLLCSELIYLNAMKAEYSTRHSNALQLADSYKTKMDSGDANILAYNKAQINLLNTSKDLEHIEVEQNTLIQQLISLNGGEKIVFNDSVFQLIHVNPDFEQWYTLATENNPVLTWLKQEIEISTKEKQLQSAQYLPKINAGYMSEKIINEHFQGITLGISIPLWENKNMIKYAQLKTEAAQSIESDSKVQFYNEMKTQHTKAINLQKSIADFKLKLLMFNSKDLLQEALNKGEISLSEYLYELSIYYESIEKLFQMEKDLNDTLAQLKMYN